MRTVEINIYKFDELSDKAKEHARQWWRNDPDAWDADPVLEDFNRIAEILGLSNVKPRYSGFSSQGDGASFTGRYEYVKDAPAKIKDYASQDAELLRIATHLATIPNAAMDITVSGRYVHSRTMSFEDIGETEMTAIDFAFVSTLLRDLADWLYRQLMASYDYAMSDENIDENLRINNYEFTTEGEIYQ